MRLTVRAARAADRPAVESLVAREVRAGTVLPRAFVPADFLVASLAGRVVGTLSTTTWATGVVELGTVISNAPGRGTGQALVQAGLARAARAGADWAVVLTSVPGFFERQGFARVPDTPWARARGPQPVTQADADLSGAIGAKAARSCRSCPHLASCAQALLARRVDEAALAWRACA